MNARFWTWINGGPVKLTLAPQGKIYHTTGGPTDEGFHHQWCTWAHDPRYSGFIYRTTKTQAKDCDGRVDTCCVDTCHILNLRSFSPPDPDIVDGKEVTYPEWVERTRCQRDHSAEAMGY